MSRQITVYENYNHPPLRQKIWEKLRDDYYGVFKAENPTSGRSTYKDKMVIQMRNFDGDFYLDNNCTYDPFADDVRSKTIENFLGKRADQEPNSNPMDKTLRFFHAYLLVKYPKIEHSLRTNDYAHDYIKILDAKYLSWKRSDQKTFDIINTLSEKLCGIYTNMEYWPEHQSDCGMPEYKAAEKRFGGAYRMLILSMLKSEPILLAHYLSFYESDIAKLKRGVIENINIGRASGAAVPSTIGLESEDHLIRFDLLMSNRKQNDLPFYFPITIDKIDSAQHRGVIHGFTAGGFDYAPRTHFLRTKAFELAGKKLFDLYGVDI